MRKANGCALMYRIDRTIINKILTKTLKKTQKNKHNRYSYIYIN
jgi:hypothetical protein